MIASELARELGIDVGVMSKRLKMYYDEAGIEGREKYLPDNIIEDMRQVDKLLASKGGIKTRDAILQVLGEIAEPVPPRSAQLLFERLEALEAGQRELKVLLSFLVDAVRTRASSKADQQKLDM